MIELTIPRMSCGGCARAITNAVQTLDPKASVDVDLTTKRVAIESVAERPRIKAAVKAAGYAIEHQVA